MVKYSDISKLSKVSTTTISHIINKTRYVSPATEQKVIDAMIRLNYGLDNKQKMEKTLKTNTIGMVISNIKNPFYQDILEGSEEIALKNDYNIFLCNTNYDIEKGKKLINHLIKKRVDGIIIVSSDAEKFVKKEFMDSKIPILLVDWKPVKLNLDSILLDYSSGFLEAVEHLNSLGHRYFCFISDTMKKSSAKKRVVDFIDCVSRYGLDYKIMEGNNKISGGISTTIKLLEEKNLPSVIFCSSELTAVGVMKVLSEKNINVPKDISIVMLDEPILTEIINPPLCSIEVNRIEIGLIATELLLNRINNPRLPKDTKIIKSKYIIRSSVVIAKKA
jgi:LacI family transcriptional regulator